MAAYELLLLNTSIPQIQAAQTGDTYVCPRDIAFSAALTLSAGTANGVPYLNGSKVLTTGSALTFDGTDYRNLAGAVASGGSVNGKFRLDRSDGATNLGYIDWVTSGDGLRFFNNNGGYFSWQQSVAGELMRLTSTGLGIGETNPATKLHVYSISARPITVGNASATWSFGPSSTNFVFRENSSGSDFLTLDSSGNLGIGTTSLTDRLNIVGAAATTLLASSTTTNQAYHKVANAGGNMYFGINNSANSFFAAAAYAGIVWHDGAYPIVFATNNTERARITSGGDFLVGTTAQTLGTARLSVDSSGLTVVSRSTASTEAPYASFNSATSGNNQFVWFYTGDAGQTFRGSIEFNRAGGLVAYNTTSDYRAKDILGPVQNPGATIDALKVYEGKMKGATVSRPMLVAHEAQEHAPYAVTGEKDAVNEDGTPKYQQMDVSSLVPLLLAEIQSLRARVAQLEGK